MFAKIDTLWPFHIPDRPNFLFSVNYTVFFLWGRNWRYIFIIFLHGSTAERNICIGKAKTIPVQANYWPWGFWEVEALRFPDNRHMKVVRLSALVTGRLYLPPPRKHSWYSFLIEADSTPVRRIMSMINSNDTFWNRTRYLPACSAVPPTTAPPPCPAEINITDNNIAGSCDSKPLILSLKIRLRLFVWCQCLLGLYIHINM